eukprot:Gregarina_sp_Poly_1__1349@NODE_1333_length_4355_cov_224_001632_g897_i0_p4_GENE_NODE_1333_length_4355_cov_224_001632_g897_i0NODE_1333_length_4355_cov_224_001632_g897_i0_p4_ORF_typecomplete_len134_score10_36BTB_2/PF02214_22/0_41BTB_2/PF02214_22/3_1e02DUF423/PF04241_15/0_29DUF423/PF04241_15/3_9e02_NODE_1333_length_4355_cov_224_001632_g897_i018152216
MQTVVAHSCLAVGVLLVSGTAYSLSHTNLKQTPHTVLGLLLHSQHPAKWLWFAAAFVGSLFVLIGTVLTLGSPLPLVASHVYQDRTTYLTKHEQDQRASLQSEMARFFPTKDLQEKARTLNLPRPTFQGAESQ